MIRTHTRAMLGSVILLVISLAYPSLASAASPQRSSNQKVIRDPAEYRAYNAAINMRDPVQKAAALEMFIRNYPDSVVKIEALEHAMAAYQQSGNNAKLEETARRVLALQPNNVRALAIITYLGREGKGDDSEVCANAQKGLREMPRWQTPEGIAEAEGHKLQAQMAAIFYGAAGFCALQAKDYGTARDYYQKALQINPNNMENSYQLGITDLEMNPIDVNGFWYIAKAMNLAQAQGNNAASQGMESYAKDKYRSYHGGEDGWSQIVKEAASQSAPPAALVVAKMRTPAELALLALQNDPFTFSDRELILTHRDASPANREAADKVWQAIQTHGKVRIPSIKVIRATRDTIQAAITDANQQANREDLEIKMEKPMTQPPTPGSVINVVGVFQSYTLNPFLFVMTHGEVPGATSETHTELSAEDIEKLLQGGVTPKRVAELVKQRGVNFTLDSSIEDRLRKAGATDELLLAIAKGRQ